MSRLPTPGGDDGNWGNLLNDFLANAHNSDGSLKDVGVVALKYTKPGSGIPEADLASSVQTKLNGGGTASDATTSTKGIIQLAGDLTGTATSPTIAAGAVTAAKIANATITDSEVAAGAGLAQTKIANLVSDLAAKQPLNTDLTTIAGITPANDDIIQRKAGTWTNRTPVQLKTDLALAKADVGLGNVDNTSDANKPVSSATATALSSKVDSSALTAHVSNATNAHAASSIGFTPTGNIAATDVQAAIAEVAIEASDDANTTAVGDGVTDDAAALTADFAANTVVRLKPGATYMADDFTIPTGKTLDLNGATLLMKPNKSSGEWIHLQSPGKIKIINGTIDGNRANETSSNYAIMAHTLDYSDIVIRNVEFSNHKDICVAVNAAATKTVTDVRIENCYAHDLDKDFAQLNAASTSTVRGVKFSDNVCATIGQAGGIYKTIQLFATAMDVFHDVVISDNVGRNLPIECIPIEVQGATNLAITGNTVDAGSLGYSLGNCKDVTITGNVARNQKNAAGVGFAVELNLVQRATISGNMFFDCEDGVMLDNASSSDIIITGNTFYGGNRAVTGITPVSRLSVIGNNFIDVGDSGSTFGICVLLQGASTDVIIKDNHYLVTTGMATGNGRRFFRADSVTRLNVSGNTLSIGKADTYTTLLGIIDVGTTGDLVDVLIANNVIRSATGGILDTVGILIRPSTTCTRVVIDGNTVENLNYGISQQHTAQPVTVTNNHTRSCTNPYSVQAADLVSTAAELEMAAAPTTGTWKVRDRVWNTVPATGAPAGWICTADGTPGTWKAMANLT